MRGAARLISSAITTLAKIGPGSKRSCVSCGLGALDQDGGAGDVGGHQVGGELDPFRLQVERPGEGAGQGRLAEPGDALEQRVAAGDQADQGAADRLGLADHRLADGGLDLVGDALELLGRERLEVLDGGMVAVSAVIKW